MRLTVAIIVDRADLHGAKLAPLVESLKSHGVDQALVLVRDDGQPLGLPETGCSAVVKLNATLPMPTVVKRIHPEYAVEAALHEASGEWVFILFAGERLEFMANTDPTADRTLGQLAHLHSKCSSIQLHTSNGLEVRGYRRIGINHIGTVGAVPSLYVNSSGCTMQPRSSPVDLPVLTCQLDLTVILPTWRLGGLDITLDALDHQSLSKERYEVIVVDALHQWRAPEVRYVAAHLQHRPVDRSIFPVSSHSRFRNTAIRRARGKRLLFLCDYSVPPPNLLAAHVDQPANVIAISPWIRTAMAPGTVACKNDPKFENALTVWDVIEHARQRQYLWSTFQPDIDPLDAALKYEAQQGRAPLVYPVNPSAHALFHTPEYMGHWKADSVDAELVRKINGWDETFDGNGGLADVDFSLRLLWAGAQQRIVEPSVRVLDAHEISVAPIRDVTRDNARRLQEVRERKAMRCIYGLVDGVVNDS